MKLGRITAGLIAIGVLMGTPASTRAEEILLKDGQKIVGTIVGYENDMFRVETAYGIALVRKDKVASIQVARPEPTNPPTPQRPAPKASGDKPAKVAAAPETAPASAPPASTPPKPVAPPPPAPVAATPEAAPGSAPSAPTPAKPVAPAPVVAAPPKPPEPPPPPASHPLDVPMPAHIEEHVDGNTYFNDTFQFSMFMPPDWKIYEGVPKETGSGIMAMGTEDERTLLIVDRQVWSGAPKLSSDEVESNLRQTYQEYRRVSEDAFECDGQMATRRTFTGVLDGAEWHGVAVHIIHGNMVFGIIGLTSAESSQFQEAIFNKIIKTFHFHAPTAPTVPPPTTHPTP